MEKASSAKEAALRRGRTRHPHPESVRDPLFLTHPFFDPSDLLQVRYEMVRRVDVEDQPVAATAKTFGVSRPTFYASQLRLRQGGLRALVPLPPGPRGPRKVLPEVLRFIEEVQGKEGRLSYRELARRVEARLGIRVEASTLLRALQKGGKKPRRRRSRQRRPPRNRP